jgi:hypothetical protein
MTTAQRPRFVVVLRPEPHVGDAIKALRAFLKVALRQFGLRAVSAREDQSASE